MSSELAQTFAAVFAPEVFLLVCTIGLVGYEWHREITVPVSGLGFRLATVGVAWIIGFLCTELPDAMFSAPTEYWVEDLFAGLGITVGFLLIAVVWWWHNWGQYLPEFAVILIVLTVSHSVIVPFWDVSSHVIYTTVPVGYFITLSRRFVPIALIPGGMVVSRPLTGAHTWFQAIGGAILGVAFVAGFLWVRRNHGRSVPTRSAVK